MSQDPVVVTTHASWLQRLGGALAGMLVGVILVLGGLTVLFGNEGRAVRAARALEEGGRLASAASPDRIDPAQEGRPVHVVGMAQASGPLGDDRTGLRISGLRLVRKVELYQWVETVRTETRTRLGGGEETVATYDYRLEWSSLPVDSNGFKQPQGHLNPEPVLRDQDFSTSQIRLGQRRLGPEAAAGLPATEPVVPLAGDAQEAERRLGRKVVVSGDALYVGADPAVPAVGDARIRYAAAPWGPISVIAGQSGADLVPYATRHGRLFEVQAGRLDAKTMLQEAKSANQVTTWLLRLAGAAAVVIGFGLLLNPAKVAADIFPPAGAIVGFGVGALALVAGSVLSAAVIAVAWLLVRPVLSAVVLGLALTVAVAVWRLRARKSALA
ncbi:hypothetical protein GVN18_22590 [Pseudomonas sp. ODNR1LW]|nr:hypothetical protein [Pseudomonas sp. ODNR1LW]